jgi:quinolinate synthase
MINIKEEILKLKKQKKAIILAHNYQRPEIQQIADYIGDSIELSRKAMQEKEAKIIVFSAVDFMAESAAILNPTKKVLLPALSARCPMAQMLTIEEVQRARQEHPNTPVVLYVNTSAAAKAEADVCCTSANAAEIISQLDADTVLFGPDHNLAEYVQRRTGKTIIPIPQHGFCPTHILFQPEDIQHLKMVYPNARVMVHPECTHETQKTADFVGSTSQMCTYAQQNKATAFVVGTENGILYRLNKENPTKQFVMAYDDAVCPTMKLNTMERLHTSLKEEKHLITVPEQTARKARKALEKMLELTEKAR